MKASVHEGEALGVEATPTMFVNGEKVDGAIPISELRAVLDRALLEAGGTAAGASRGTFAQRGSFAFGASGRQVTTCTKEKAPSPSNVRRGLLRVLLLFAVFKAEELI